MVRRVVSQKVVEELPDQRPTPEPSTLREMTSHVPLSRCPGMINLLSLEPVPASQLPGIEFDVFTRKLDVRPDLDFYKTFCLFPPWLPYRQIHPTLCLRREKLWEDQPTHANRSNKGPKMRQRISRNHHAHQIACLRSELFHFAAGDKWAIVHGSLAPRIPGGTFALERYGQYHPWHKNLAIKPEDATVTAEFRGDLVVPKSSSPSVSLFWIDWNVNYHLLARSYNYMHRGNGAKPDPEADLLSMILTEFANTLESYTLVNRRRNLRFAQLQLTVMNGTPVPFILAVRGVFLFFLWEGGFHGKFVFQYGGNLIPGRHLVPDIA